MAAVLSRFPEVLLPFLLAGLAGLAGLLIFFGGDDDDDGIGG